MSKSEAAPILKEQLVIAVTHWGLCAAAELLSLTRTKPIHVLSYCMRPVTAKGASYKLQCWEKNCCAAQGK